MGLEPRSRTVGGLVQDASAPVFRVLHTPSGGEVPREPVLPESPATIGEIVLFFIDTNLVRPLLVVSLGEMARVAGILFLDGDKDRNAAWVRKFAFSPPTKATPQLYVEGVRFGEELGQWKKRVSQGVVSAVPIAAPELGKAIQSNSDNLDIRATE